MSRLSFYLLLIIVLLTSTVTAQKDAALKVLQFNIWQEGTMVPGGFEAIIDEIIATNADLIALSEVRNYDDKNLAERLVNALAKKGHT